jgi:hypothetical protein
MKILRIVAIATLTVITMPGIVVAQTNPTPPSPPTPSIEEMILNLKGFKPAPVVHAIIPTEMGCHEETSPGKLTKVDCLSPEEIAKHPPPAPCTGADGDAACGMQSTVTAAQQKKGTNKIPITEAYLGVTLQEYSSSLDTLSGNGAYSLQLNTNWFQAGPGTTGWVQFSYQNFLSSAQFCVWNWHWPTNSNPPVHTPVCSGVKSIPLTARVQFTVGAFVCAGSCTYFRPNGTSGPAVLWGWIHWDTLDASGKVCSSCDSGTVWATAPDTEGLASNWTQISGSILGSGTNGAGVTGKLNFKANAVVRNVLAGTACPIPLAPSWTCNSPQLNGQYADTAGWVTAEANNLYYAPSPNWVIPQLPQSNLACSNGFCSLTAYEIYPK